MQLEQKKDLEKWGEKAGFAASYLIFTTLLFLVLSSLKRLPSGWTYFHIMALTLLIVLLGLGIKRLLR